MRNLAQRPIVLIVASSGRMLAQAAKAAGFTPLVIDLYEDRDTLALAEKVYPVVSLHQECLQPVFDAIKQKYAVDYACFGSGLEAYPDSLLVLSRTFKMTGNDPMVVQQIQDKTFFFEVLDRLSIDHPETVFIAPDDECHWLVKPNRGQGGLGIKRFALQNAAQDGVYWQRFIDGVAGSVLFLADGSRSEIIGFNTQWCHRVDDQQAYVFSGAINQNPLTAKQKQSAACWVTLLVAEFGLKGLNSMDFIVRGETVSVLEINPRPSASMQLYDAARLFGAHIQSCSGLSRRNRFCLEGFCGYQVVFADRDVLIPEVFYWPCQAADLPGPGTLIRAGAPICSLIVRSASVQGVLQTFKAARQKIFQMLYKG